MVFMTSLELFGTADSSGAGFSVMGVFSGAGIFSGTDLSGAFGEVFSGACADESFGDGADAV